MSKYFACVEQKRCVACGACTAVCPKAAVSVYKGCYAVIDAQLCIGCGKCEKVCPAGCIARKEREGNEK